MPIMVLHFVVALFWLVLALASLIYFFVHPGGGKVDVLGSDVSVMWVAGFAAFMFCFRMLRWWMILVQKHQQKVMDQIYSGRSRHHLEEPNPDFDFSECQDKRPNEK
jgi:hypothetical protein